MNLPITSREYKLILNSDRFQNRAGASNAFWAIVKFLVEEQAELKGTVETKIEEEIPRRTWYLDTSEFALDKYGIALRIREEEDGEFQITLKCREADRYVSANYDMSHNFAGAKDPKVKFEEDIMPPFISKFAHSVSFKCEELPELERMEQAVAIFPGLQSIPIPDVARLRVVNRLQAHEVVLELGEIDFGPKPDVKASLSFWYLQAPAVELPLVTEFSFDYDLPKKDTIPQDKLESFDVEMVAKANAMFRSLQAQKGWVDLTGTTKTAYAYRARV